MTPVVTGKREERPWLYFAIDGPLRRTGFWLALWVGFLSAILVSAGGVVAWLSMRYGMHHPEILATVPSVVDEAACCATLRKSDPAPRLPAPSSLGMPLAVQDRKGP